MGRPLGLLLTRRSENATVTLCHTGTRDLAAHVRRADIVVAAAGVPGLVTADMVKPGAAVLDVGRQPVGADGRLRRGDVAADVAEVAGWLRPNPGGVGPMTRAMLLANVVEAAERRARPPMTAPRLGAGGSSLSDSVPGCCWSSPGTCASAATSRPRRWWPVPGCGWCCRRPVRAASPSAALVDVVILLGLGSALFVTVRAVELAPRR